MSPSHPVPPAWTTAADLNTMIAEAEAHCATCFRALAAATDERDARLLRGLLCLEEEELALLRARRDRLLHRP